jgi:hypothetical protein
MEEKMGLDMYAFTTTEDVPAVDFGRPANLHQIHYWRKHPNLHGWMEKLYRKKGGQADDFNLAPVVLTEADLADLEGDVMADRLPVTAGFFFGESRPEEKQEDLDFIQKARAAIADGKKVFYTSWW